MRIINTKMLTRNPKHTHTHTHTPVLVWGHNKTMWLHWSKCNVFKVHIATHLSHTHTGDSQAELCMTGSDLYIALRPKGLIMVTR